jgi:hypothetical protein
MKISKWDLWCVFMALMWAGFAILDFVQDDPLWLIAVDLAVAGLMVGCLVRIRRDEIK